MSAGLHSCAQGDPRLWGRVEGSWENAEAVARKSRDVRGGQGVRHSASQEGFRLEVGFLGFQTPSQGAADMLTPHIYPEPAQQSPFRATHTVVRDYESPSDGVPDRRANVTQQTVQI